MTSTIHAAGLPSAQAEFRLRRDGPNVLPHDGTRSLARQVWDVIREPILVLLIAASAISFAIADLLDGVVLTSFVAFVIVITVYQERKTELVLRALSQLAAPQALVVRDGVEQRLPSSQVVRDDLMVLTEGARVPADGMLIAATHLMLDESTLTGESVPVGKCVVDGTTTMGPPGGENSPWVFSGTIVVSGHAMAIVAATGAHTELGRIGTALASIAFEHTPLQREIKRIVAVIASLGLAAAFVVFLIYRLTRGEWLQAGLAGIATAMAMLPEEFPVVLSVFMALGAWRMAKHGVLARRSAVIETLGTASVVCVDKTGTLTANRMSIGHLVPVDQAGELTRWAIAGRGRSALSDRQLAMVDAGALASPVHTVDPMDRAFHSLAQEMGRAASQTSWQVVREYPISADLLIVCQIWQSADGRRRVAYAKGAPEAILAVCSLPDDASTSTRRDLSALAEQGERVLGLAQCELPTSTALPASPTDLRFTYLGLAGLMDPVRPGVPDAVEECRKAGVRSVMITGDYPGTALAIARQAGLDTSAGCLTGAEVDGLDDPELIIRVRTTNVFARMRPEQKLRLVRALQSRHAIVAMTGDGVNDAPALRAADIGIAFGQRGTDVAREAAALVITDDAYGSIVEGIRQGRRIFSNLRKAMAYVIAVHVPIFGMSLIPVFVTDWPIVLLPIQVAFLELIIDPACSVAFEAEPGDPRAMERPPRPPGQPLFHRRVLAIAIGQGLVALTAVLGIYLWSLSTDQSAEHVRSVTFATLVIGNLALIVVNRSWEESAWRVSMRRRNAPVRWILIAATALLVCLICVPFMRSIFDLAALTPIDWAVAISAGLGGAAWFEGYKFVRRRVPSHHVGAEDPTGH